MYVSDGLMPLFLGGGALMLFCRMEALGVNKFRVNRYVLQIIGQIETMR